MYSDSSYNVQKLGNKPANFGSKEQCKLMQPYFGSLRSSFSNMHGAEYETIRSIFSFLSLSINDFLFGLSTIWNLAPKIFAEDFKLLRNFNL